MTTLKNWEWAESCEPEFVTEHNVFQVHWLLAFPEGCNSDFGKCKRVSTCKNSPYCLNGVTPTSLYKSIRDSKKELDKLKEINDQKRAQHEYVGLDNLGATCYINSYLQMWFHTSSFRRLILSYKPMATSEIDKEHDDSIESTIHQMRVLFAQMILTKKRSLLPEAFIETLGLDPSNQQDAQEFSNLWMGILQHRFGTAFSRLFCGSCDVSTVCDACQRASRKPDEFSELILNVPATEAVPQVVDSPGRRQGTSVNLEDVMRRYFGDEVLDGDNAYECNFPSCGKKGKAVRRTRLEKAPAILNAQVLRFAFDPVKMARKKLRTNISFPEHLELRREYFAEDSPELNSPSLPRYRIKAILCHIGTTVIRGHYTARIRLRDGWYIFNDAIVKKGDPTCGGDGGVDADESGGSSGRRFRSADAYCIVYHRVGAHELDEDNDDVFSCSPSIPADLRAEVEQVEERFRSELEKKRDDIMANSDAKEQTREHRLRIRRKMALTLPMRSQLQNITVEQVKQILDNQTGGGAVFMQKDFLQEYFGLKTSEEVETAFGLGTKACCPHGRLGTEQAGNIKLIPKETADLIAQELEYSSPKNTAKFIWFTHNDLCLTCVRLGCFELFYTTRAEELTRMAKVELKHVDNRVNEEERIYWIPRDVVEKIGDMAKEALVEAEHHLEGEVKALCNEPAVTLKTEAIDRTTATIKMFKLVDPTDNNISDVPKMFVILNNKLATLEPVIVRSNHSPLSSPGESCGPTPKRAKIVNNSNDGSSGGPENRTVVKGVTKSEPVSLAEEHTANGLSSAHEETRNSHVRAELPQEKVLEIARHVFKFVQQDVNKDTCCEHGSVWVSAPSSSSTTGRKSRAGSALGLIRISSDLWERIVDFFPNSMACCYPDFVCCERCGDVADRERLEAERIREEAKQLSKRLGDLTKRVKRPKVETALRPIHLVSAEFLNRLTDVISCKTPINEARKLDNLRNLCRHGKLTYSPEELAEEVALDTGCWVATKHNEWKILKDEFVVDVEVVLKPVIEKLNKDAAVNGHSEATSYVPLTKFLTDNQSVPKRISPSDQGLAAADEGFERRSVDSRRDDAIEVSSEDTVTWDEEDEQLTDDDDFVIDMPAKGRGRGKGKLAAVRGRGRGKGAGESGRLKKSKRIGWCCLPLTCRECQEERLIQLAITRSTPQPLVWDGAVYVRFESGQSEKLTPPRYAVHTRRKRHVPEERRKLLALSGEELDYIVGSTCSFVELQMAVMADFEISPLEQLLYITDEDTKAFRQVTPVNNPERTLGEMQIRDGQIFVLRRKEEDDDDEHVVAPIEVDENKKSKSGHQPEGFRGTLLSVLANASPMKRPISPGPSSST